MIIKLLPSPLKVIYIINHPVPYGANVALLNILDGVTKKGITPFVVMGEKGAICNELKKRNIDYEVVNYFFSVYPNLICFRDYLLFFPRLGRLYLTNYNASQKLIRIAKTFKAEIIHTNIGPAHIGYDAAKILQIPHVWHIREYQDLYFKMRPIPSMAGFSRKLNSKNNYSIAITNDLLKHYKMGNNARVIYDGVMSRTQYKFIPEKENYFLFVGRLVESKGIKQLIKSFIDFSNINKTYELQIAGSGQEDYVFELKGIVDSASLNHRIKFLGFRKDVYDLMAKATALIVPSRSEGFGFITAEAMFNGCLVIGNNSGGTKEILEKENLGILYSGHEELVAAMNTIVTNGIESYFPTIMKAQKQARIFYSTEQNVESILKLYSQILKK